MPAYVILDIEVHDPTAYDAYKTLAQSAVQLYGGKYIVRGGEPETLEGDWQTKRVVILEFADKDQAKYWLNSPEYAPARRMRERAATSRSILVDGL